MGAGNFHVLLVHDNQFSPMFRPEVFFFAGVTIFRNFAYVTFDNEKSAYDAVAQEEGNFFMGRKIGKGYALIAD